MKSITALLTGSLALTLGTAFLWADWVVVDRFEDPELPNWYIHIPNADNPDRVDPDNPPYITVIPDPFGGSGNALEIFPGVLIDNTVNMFASLLVPEEARIVDPFPEVGLSTLYFRVARPMVGNRPAQISVSYGLVGYLIDEMGNLILDEDGDPQRPTTWGHYSVQARWSNQSTIDIRDEAMSPQFVPVRPEPFSTDTWYEIWFVINHPENTFRQYMRGGLEFPGPDPVLVYPFDESVPDASYRTATFEDLAYFYIGTTTGSVSGGASGIDPSYLSEIHIDPTGMNLTTPPLVGGGGPVDPVEPVQNPFDALVEGEWTDIPAVGLNYGFHDGPGWSYHVDLGPFYSAGFPWLYHQPAGYLYYVDGDYETSGIFLFNEDLGWLYTVAGSGGRLYVYNADAWVRP